MRAGAFRFPLGGSDKGTFTTRQLIAVCLCLVLLAQSGCALPRPRLLPPLPPEQVRAQLGTIGVVSARFVPAGSLEGPTSGKGSGAAKGAGAGFFGMIGGGLQSGNPVGAALGIGLSPLGAAVGAVVGAVVAEPSATVEATEATLKKAIADLKIQETIRDRLVQVGQEQTRHRFLILVEHGPTTLDQEVSYRSLATEGVDTILEVRVLSLGLVGQGINPPLALVMTVRVRLIRVVDDTALYDRPLIYHSGERKFTEWASNNAQPLRDELARAQQLFAENIVEKLFLLYVPFKIES